MEQHHTRSHIRKIDLEFDWRGAIAGLGALLFFSVFGPFLLFIGLLLQRWGSSSIWRAQDRWASIRALSLALPLLYLPTYLFWNELAFWWSRLPAFLGAWSIMPPAWGSLAAHTILTLPLVPALALLLERGQAHTFPVRYVMRQPRPGEIIVPPRVTGLVAAPEGSIDVPAKRKASPKKSAAATQMPLLEASSAPKPARKRQVRDPRPLGEVLVEEKARRAAPPMVLPPDRPKIDWSQVKE